MNHLVLGSSGQIGSHLVEYLLSQGETVQKFDIVEEEQADLRIPNNKILLERMEKADFVHFLAFDVGGARYLKKFQNSKMFLDNNIQLMKNTFDALEKCNKPFIFSSSQMSNMDYSSYGVLKRVGEYYTKTLGGLTVKYWNVYGLETDMNKSHVITDFIKKAIETKNIDMMTDGEEERQFLYAGDCCRCLKVLADNYHSLDKTQEYHVTSFKWHKIIDVADIICDYFGDVKVTRGQTKDSVQNNKRNEPNEFIKNYWSPEISLRQGIYEIIDKMVEHKQ